MKYNFDEIIERRGTNSVKWDGVKNIWGRDDLLPMWVADMDFRTPPFVMDALRKRLEHEVLGYTFACEEWYNSICTWLHDRHQWDISREMLTFVPGIVRGQAFALQCFTNPGDKVMVMTPVYHPFFLVTERMGREVVYSPLELQDGQYHINFERFRKDLQGCKVLILCNPHNPGGVVWPLETLQRIAEICARHNILIIADEIHADMPLFGAKHHPFASVSETAAQNSISFGAPSKTFNIAGLVSSYAIVPNETIRKRFFDWLTANELNEPTFMATIATEAAYNHCREWREQMLAYIEQNILFVEEFLDCHIPDIKAIRPQASFIVWLDCTRLHLEHDALIDLFVDKARLALNDGEMFGPEGKGHMRLNVGTPRAVLQKALEQLRSAVDGLKR